MDNQQIIPKKMRELALFAGAGGGLLASELLGWSTICAVEVNEYAQRVLVARQNDGCLQPFPIWDDIRTFDGTTWCGLIDIVSGGFPCQPFSTASHGRQNAWNGWGEMFRIITEVNPTFVFAENVSAKAIETAAYDLQSIGFQTSAIKLSAADLGADHLRERFWLRAYSNNESKLCSTNNAEMARLSEFCNGIWSTVPIESGMADGLVNRMERYKAIGNGQIPIMAAVAWTLLNNYVGK